MDWSREAIEQICKVAQDRINLTTARSLMARHSREEPPNDPRHLTDTRTRVSNLLEYSLAYELNQMLLQENNGHFVSCVLWNVFPDLVIRDGAGQTVVGLEVKALHTAAEEKSANLATAISQIVAETDFMVVMIWGWERSDENGGGMRYPRIYFSEVFSAQAIARIRDYTWLKSQGNRIKGIDISTPIISSEDAPAKFKAEEGNLGKLMRIKFNSETSVQLHGYSELKNEGDRLERFQNRILGSALIEVFKEVCFGLGISQITHLETSEYPSQCQRLATGKARNGSSFHLYAGPRLDPLMLPADQAGTLVLWLGRKLEWRILKKQANSWIALGNGLKAETAIGQIDKLICEPIPEV